MMSHKNFFLSFSISILHNFASFFSLTCGCTHLVDEGGEAVVQCLDLLLLLGADDLDAGVDLQVQGGQQALVDRHRCDGGRRLVSHADSDATSKADVAKLQPPCSLPRPSGHVPANYLEAPSAHRRTAAAHPPVGAADGEALSAAGTAAVAREGAAAVALGGAPG